MTRFQEGQNLNSQLSNATFAKIFPIETPKSASIHSQFFFVNGLSMIVGCMGEIGAGIAVESCLFKFWPCSWLGRLPRQVMM